MTMEWLLVQLGLDALGVDLLDAGAAVAAVGLEAGLPAGQGDHGQAHGLNGHGAQGAGDLLAGGQQHIHLPLGCVGVDLLGLFNEVVGGVALGGEDRHHLVALSVGVRDDLRHVADAVGVGHGGPAEFLYNQSHLTLPPVIRRAGDSGRRRERDCLFIEKALPHPMSRAAKEGIYLVNPARGSRPARPCRPGACPAPGGSWRR